MEAVNLREITTDALKYWEPRRIAYNALLAGVVFYHSAAGWLNGTFRPGFDDLLGLFILAVLANVAYCAAYVVDFVLQLSYFREGRGRWRLAVMVVGFAFAAALTRFFALGITHSRAGEMPF